MNISPSSHFVHPYPPVSVQLPAHGARKYNTLVSTKRSCQSLGRYLRTCQHFGCCFEPSAAHEETRTTTQHPQPSSVRVPMTFFFFNISWALLYHTPHKVMTHDRGRCSISQLLVTAVAGDMEVNLFGDTYVIHSWSEVVFYFLVAFVVFFCAPRGLIEMVPFPTDLFNYLISKICSNFRSSSISQTTSNTAAAYLMFRDFFEVTPAVDFDGNAILYSWHVLFLSLLLVSHETRHESRRGK